MVVMGELETADESEQETTDSDNYRYSCPFCGSLYKLRPKRCEHLLCEVEFVESNNEFLVALGHPVVASLLGMEVPRVVACRFMHFLRTQPPRGPQDSNTPSPSTTITHGVRTMNLTTNPYQPDRRRVVTIKYSREDAESFREWTYYLTAHPVADMRLFVAFVKKQYCDNAGEYEGEDGDVVVAPFSRVQVCPEVMALHVNDLIPEKREAGNWVMVTGLPDNLPLFFFAVTMPDQSTMFINHSTNLANRMRDWDAAPAYVNIHSIIHLPTVVVN